MLEILNNKKGFSIVAILVSAVLLSGGFYVVMDGSRVLAKLRYSLNRSYAILQTRQLILSTLNSEEGLMHVTATNADLSCLDLKTDCSGKKNTAWPIMIETVEHVKLVDPADPSLGFNPAGQVCHEFNSSTGSTTCPYRFEVDWEPICPPSGDCLRPQNRFHGKLLYNSPAEKIDFDVKKLEFMIFPTVMDGSSESSCTALNGTFDPSTGSCSLPLAGLCPVGQIVIGIDNNNNKICAPLYNKRCRPGYAIDGTSIGGALHCKRIAYCPTEPTNFPGYIPWEAEFGSGGTIGYPGDGCDGAGVGGDGGS